MSTAEDIKRQLAAREAEFDLDEVERKRRAQQESIAKQKLAAKSRTIVASQTKPPVNLKQIATAAISLPGSYDAKAKAYEKQADYKTIIGLKDLNNPVSQNKIKARFAHMTMRTASSFVVTGTAIAATAAAGVGGTVIAGLVGAATALSFINPANRQALNQHITNHPQDFMATIGGALLAGYTVPATQNALRQYSKNLKIQDRRAMETTWDKMIDDVNFKEQQRGAEFPQRITKRQLALQRQRAARAFEDIIDDVAFGEQQKGAEFPSRIIEVPEPGGDQIWINNPVNPEEDILLKFMEGTIKENKGDVVTKFWKNAKAKNINLYYESGGDILESVTLQDLFSQHPSLDQPFAGGAFTDPNVLNKANIVAKDLTIFQNPALLDFNVLNKASIVARAGQIDTTLMTVVLATAAAQGFISKEQIEAIIAANEKQLEYLRQQNIQIPSQYQDGSVRNATAHDIMQDTEELVVEIVEPIIPIPTPTPPPKPPKRPPRTPPVKPPPPPPPTPTTPPPVDTLPLPPIVKLTKADRQALKLPDLHFKFKKMQRFRVTHDKGTKVVRAKTFKDALLKAGTPQKSRNVTIERTPL